MISYGVVGPRVQMLYFASQLSRWLLRHGMPKLLQCSVDASMLDARNPNQILSGISHSFQSAEHPIMLFNLQLHPAINVVHVLGRRTLRQSHLWGVFPWVHWREQFSMYFDHLMYIKGPKSSMWQRRVTAYIGRFYCVCGLIHKRNHKANRCSAGSFGSWLLLLPMCSPGDELSMEPPVLAANKPPTDWYWLAHHCWLLFVVRVVMSVAEVCSKKLKDTVNIWNSSS